MPIAQDLRRAIFLENFSSLRHEEFVELNYVVAKYENMFELAVKILQHLVTIPLSDRDHFEVVQQEHPFCCVGRKEIGGGCITVLFLYKSRKSLTKLVSPGS